MLDLKKVLVAAMISGVTVFGMSSVSYANADAKAACTKQAEEDGYTGEEKANAIKLCMEEMAGSGDSQQQK